MRKGAVKGGMGGWRVVGAVAVYGTMRFAKEMRCDAATHTA